MVGMNKWDERFLDLAAHIALWSKDPSSKIGAVAIGENRNVLSLGYNGFPRNVWDGGGRLEDKDIKYKLVVHAECNCIFNAGKNGVSLKGATLYVSGIPVCNECAKGVIQSGITRVVMRHKPMTEKWRESFQWTKLMFSESYVEWEAHETSSGSRDEPSGQAYTGFEAEPNLQTLRALGTNTEPLDVLIREYGAGAWSREHASCSVGPTPGSSATLREDTGSRWFSSESIKEAGRKLLSVTSSIAAKPFIKR
jgi:dCMP deaminase